ncbi:MAG: exodeoxyribonuclease VII small subunit [Pseudomonadota bacterium]
MAADTSTAAGTDDIAAMSFERALKELETIVHRLERGDVELEESIAIYERGSVLSQRCDDLLRRAQAKVEKLTVGRDGHPTGTTELDPS